MLAAARAPQMTPEKKAKSLLAEINNGRWAMIGIIGVLSTSKGAIVPGLDSLPIAPCAPTPPMTPLARALARPLASLLSPRPLRRPLPRPCLAGSPPRRPRV